MFMHIPIRIGSLFQNQLGKGNMGNSKQFNNSHKTACNSV